MLPTCGVGSVIKVQNSPFLPLNMQLVSPQGSGFISFECKSKGLLGHVVNSFVIFFSTFLYYVIYQITFLLSVPRSSYFLGLSNIRLSFFLYRQEAVGNVKENVLSFLQKS